jgi:hypothetical protein
MKNLKQPTVKKYSQETALGYFINAVISARLDTGCRSNTFCPDEDVNIYLANLLANFSSDDYLTGISKHICLYESDLIAKQ